MLELVRPRTASRALFIAFAACVSLSACADKTLLPTAVRSPLVALQLRTNFAAQNAPTARSIEVNVGYDRLSGSRVTIGATTIAAADGAQQISIPINLAGCIADENRAGARDACPLRISVALRDTGATALDSVEVGPVDGVAGGSPSVPQIDLAIQRFAVRQWTYDNVLQLAVNPPASPTGIVGFAAGTSPPSLFQWASGGTQGGAVIAFENGRWRVIPLGQPNTTFIDFEPISATEGWLTGGNNVTNGLFRFDGSSATRVPNITDTLFAVDAEVAGPTKLIMATGQGSVVWRGDGTTWVRDQAPGSLPLNGVCITALDEAFVASSNTQSGTAIFRWNGSTYSQVFSGPPGTSIAQLRCAGRGEAYFRFNQGGTGSLLAWNGTAWNPISNAGLPASPLLGDLSVVSPTEIYGWGVDGFSVRHWFRFNGVAWSEIAQSTYGQAIFSWSDPRGGRVYIADGSRLEGYDATAGGRSTLAYIPSTQDAMFSSPTNGFVVGKNTFRARWNGTRWTVDPPPANTPVIRTLRGVWTDGPSNAWAVGNSSTIFRWNGTQWTVVSDVLNQVAGLDNYNGVWGSGSTVLIAADGGILRCTPTCARDLVPGTGPLRSVSGSSLTNVFAVGDGGRIVRYDGTTWTAMTSPTTRRLARVWTQSASNAWATGDSVLVHFDGNVWTTVPMTGVLASMQIGIGPTADPPQIGLWGSAANDVYLGGQTGKIVRYDGAQWTLMPTQPTLSRMLSISGAPGLGAIAFGDHAEMLRGLGPNGAFSSSMAAPTIWP